ncbi:MAG: Holliday junction resolvase RuvX [Actinomycetota bacterium]
MGERAGTGRVLGLDLGDVRIGVAISDPDRRLAVPLGTVQVGRPPGEMRAIADLVRENQVALVVIGEPISLDGVRRARATHAANFAEALRAMLTVPVLLHDERLSTAEAERALRDAGVTGKRRRSVIDAAAAQVILQSWLDGRPSEG